MAQTQNTAGSGKKKTTAPVQRTRTTAKRATAPAKPAPPPAPDPKPAAPAPKKSVPKNSAPKKRPAATKTVHHNEKGGSTTNITIAAPAAATTNTPPRPTSSVGAAQRLLEAQRKERNRFYSVMMFAIGVLTLLFAWINGAKGWAFMHEHLLGYFGINARLLFPGMLIYLAISIGQNKEDRMAGKVIWGILLTVVCGGMWQIYFGETVWTEGFKATMVQLYDEGQKIRGGGVVSGVVAWPLIALFDYVGAKIVVLMLAFVFVMMMTNKGVVDLFKIMCKPFIWLWDGIGKLATHGEYLYDDDGYGDFDDDDEFDDDDDNDNEDGEDTEGDSDEEVSFFPKLEHKPHPRRRRQPEILADGNQLAVMHDMFSQIDVDVPIYEDETNGKHFSMGTSEEDPFAAVQPAATAQNTVDEEEIALQAMIANAEGKRPTLADFLPWKIDENPEDVIPVDESIYEEEQPIPYIAPPLSLLAHIDTNANSLEKSTELREKSQRLKDTLASFGVEVRIVGMRRGPSVTRYEIQPAAGVKISKITALADDIGMNLGGEKVRIEAPIPGKPAVGVEVANNTKDMVPIRDILESAAFQESASKLTFAVGKDIDGDIILGDIAKMPHMIIAGTTGSGKSVCTNSIIMSVLYHASPEEVRLVLIDPKVVEFAPYDGIPHLLIPVVTNPQKAAGALNWAVIEMERRYALCAQYGVRDLKGYNALAERNPELKKLPQILIIIDEFADLMMSASKEVETAVIRIAQKARAAGIHLIIATQRPTVDVITGLIKANVPSRIGMSVKSSQDSRIILDCTGAETLLGNGDLLFYPNGWREPKRVQGCFCSDAEVEAVTNFLKNNGASEYDAEIMDAVEQNVPVPKGEKSIGSDEGSELSGDEELIIRAAEYAVDAGQLSTTALQRRLKLGYARAARIVDELEERGVIGPSEGAKPRKVLISPQEMTEWKLRIASKGGRFDE